MDLKVLQIRDSSEFRSCDGALNRSAIEQPIIMHTTKHDSAMADAQASAGSPFFSAGSSLSERELITMASDLVAPAHVTDRFATRILDVTLAIALLVFLLPLLALVAAAIAATSHGPILFKHKRIGLYGREFGCFKFRSMRTDAETHLAALLDRNAELRHEWDCNQKLKHDPRITPIGQFLRLSSIDELPQLINVIRGEMSLVGPRPIIRAEVPRYGRYITTYISVRPGITGIWQVSGRNNLSYRRRVAADVLYARSRSLWLDLKILFMTIPAVISGKGSC
ncbi:sugar transferase [Altererythrobacter sp. BO-6]|uniref:sugar transferase n=1 Tax=Altererythrobacter sp. BO-6 TaxID=2604537 RepID=UPI001F49AE22|nr:sugar transferase [Altererythrobacter sp. BO-6]